MLVGTLLGGVGAVVGAFLGYGIRRRLDLYIKDLRVALNEDAVAISLTLLVSRPPIHQQCDKSYLLILRAIAMFFNGRARTLIHSRAADGAAAQLS